MQDGLIQVFKDMITDFDVDGFRVDTVKHVNDEFWQAFGPEIETHADSLGKDDFFVFGEVFDSNPAVTSRFSTTLPLDALLDFGFQGNALGSRPGAGRPTTSATSTRPTTSTPTPTAMPPRCRRSSAITTWAASVGSYVPTIRAPTTPNCSARDELAHALMYFGRGMPVVYYGDEQGFTGDGGDKAARQDMMPSARGRLQRRRPDRHRRPPPPTTTSTQPIRCTRP